MRRSRSNGQIDMVTGSQKQAETDHVWKLHTMATWEPGRKHSPRMCAAAASHGSGLFGPGRHGRPNASVIRKSEGRSIRSVASPSDQGCRPPVQSSRSLSPEAYMR